MSFVVEERCRLRFTLLLSINLGVWRLLPATDDSLFPDNPDEFVKTAVNEKANGDAAMMLRFCVKNYKDEWLL